LLDDQPPVIVPRALVWPVGITALLWAGLLVVTGGVLTAVYHPIVIAVGWAMWRRRDRVAGALRALPVSPVLRAVLIGYLAVVAEETLAGVLHAVQEGSGAAGALLRIRQFIAFNLLAFTGIVWALALAARHLALGRHDLFVAAGAWGLFAEGTLSALAVHPLAAVLLVLPTAAVYAVILWPAQAALAPGERGHRRWPAAGRLAAVWAAAYALSVPSVLALTALRDAHPDWFPPCAYIACG
jgi:hypothetical protein